ncbi:hypothetical protein Acsp04_43000 [Actinomadura sp. NBRC 104425]|uniref:hypothetical protein n=1 Tax=Actinomadura sp. NBRC 104425 TaxID=3032204 RepID=UPI0024A56BA4|nr:hypothetical protein [Actinomadura sp. NBRC 104425]GLZ14065.1 hypothetical protein Acsp04_43000 [Actinomadura sp. NBRC 104425]
MAFPTTIRLPDEFRSEGIETGPRPYAYVATRRVDLHGESLREGDGLLLRGRTLLAVQNRLNAVAVLRLNASGTEGRVVRRVSDRRFDVPATVAASGGRLHLPNARFDTPPTWYNAVAHPRP